MIQRSATELLGIIRHKQMSCEEIVRAYLVRMDAVHDRINAVVFRADERALTRARDADQALAIGRTWGRLHGLPVTIKDSFNVEGMPTTLGLPSLKDSLADRNATAVKRLLDAGAIVLGKTNLPVLTAYFETDNPLHGRTNNPYDLTRTPGGSSGGEAAIIAACGSPLGLGGDTGGSIRVPSHFCGIAGLRPAWGRVPVSGQLPTVHEAGTLFGTAGPMARRVDDVGLALEILSGPSADDPFSFPIPLPDYRTVDLHKLRIACWERVPPTIPTEETCDTIRRVAKALSGTVAAVTDEQPAHLEKVCDIIHTFGSKVFGELIPADLRKYGLSDLDPLTKQVIEFYQAYLARTPNDVLEQAKTEWLTLVRTNVLACLEKCDVIITPVCSYPAMKHATTNASSENLNGFVWTWLFSLVPGVPAGVVRCGISPDGLPIGVQVAAKPYREDLALAVMKHLEDEFGGYTPPTL